MKTLVEFYSFSKQKLVSSRISKNQNSKSYLTSNQTDTNSKSKEKGKSKEDNSLSNRIIRANIKFPNDNSVKKDGRVNEKKNEETIIHSKIFEISVDKIFSYMKTILSIDIYANINVAGAIGQVGFESRFKIDVNKVYVSNDVNVSSTVIIDDTSSAPVADNTQIPS